MVLTEGYQLYEGDLLSMVFYYVKYFNLGYRVLVEKSFILSCGS
jgi:hypothetical protein